ncbi:MAG: ABC transporter ATP-binding protein [Microbacteriaceae bacterium]|nr:ABC transporter ATP-binding protein [Microbacteriaceae bacterium]
MAHADPVVSVRNLQKSYGSVTALTGVTFEIQRGETFALLGPNGAGKSTTIEILEGYRDRTGGDARVLGIDPQKGGVAWKARLGIVLQSTGEIGNATVREQLSHFACYYPNPRSVEEVIAAVSLDGHESKRIRALLGGQRRRVDVALGIIGRPELLFLDEPTTGFDPEARQNFWQLIRELKREGTTILLITHYLDEAAQLGDRAAVISGGTVIAQGRIDEIGGPDALTPVVRWRDDSGTKRSERAAEPAAFVAELHARVGREPDALEIIRPSLEDIYLDLVGAHENRAQGNSARENGAHPQGVSRDPEETIRP